MSEKSHMEYRRRRVKRLKRIILGTVFLLITVPIALCIWLMCELNATENELAEITAQYEAQMQITDDLQEQLDEEKVSAKEAYDELMAQITAAEDESDEGAETADAEADKEEDNIRRVYLTFDDGPSIYTEQILDILDEYGVKATFFLTGSQVENSPDICRKIAEKGHSIGMHSYSHVYSDIYKSKDNFIKDYIKVRDVIFETTGVTPKIYRFPGGSSNTVSKTDMDELCEFLADEGVEYYDWNISSGDATKYTLTSDKIAYNCISSVGKFKDAVILLHDTGTKLSTVRALPAIIEGIQKMEDTEILPITEDSEVIQHRKSKEIE